MHKIINNINYYDLDYDKIVESLNSIKEKEHYVIVEEYKNEIMTNRLKIRFIKIIARKNVRKELYR